MTLYLEDRYSLAEIENLRPGDAVEVNGKTYTGTTDSKGVATVKVSLSKKGTYSFTAKFAGDGMYKETSVSSKLTLK